jgi:hypothetical protein
MWRSFFLAIGVYLVLLGGQCLAVDKFVLNIHEKVQAKPGVAKTAATAVGPAKTIVPADWVPWSLMSTGAVICLYSFTLPRRAGN